MLNRRKKERRRESRKYENKGRQKRQRKTWKKEKWREKERVGHECRSCGKRGEHGDWPVMPSWRRYASNPWPRISFYQSVIDFRFMNGIAYVTHVSFKILRVLGTVSRLEENLTLRSIYSYSFI